ncbi:hypothetical protein LGH83_08645 [Lichenihabitans sp. PAMC28606]|uniref:hypothetical protein n=1 Tax=Lichenihabitans sp. PAMC28606 TaxID=2880932 RepID=UPI001D09EC90|nr:hypothetical protein [Lichenihabitans sp. PAMC28606]UDL96230.1 hypothetical protein LGH83_08645 [Lichenihabitans sp. PAMC28606]
MRLPAPDGYIPIWTYWLLFFLFVGGLALASVAGAGGFCSESAASSIINKAASNCFEFWVNRYQSLIAGLFALIAACVGYKAIQKQIASSEDIVKKALARERLASISVLSLALSDVCDYANLCVKSLVYFQRAPRPGPAFQAPVFPDSVVSILRECIRADADQLTGLASLISQIQVFRARIRGEEHSPSSVESHLYDALELYVRASDLFDLARNGVERPLTDRSKLLAAARIIGVDVERYYLLSRRLGV